MAVEWRGVKRGRREGSEGEVERGVERDEKMKGKRGREWATQTV